MEPKLTLPSAVPLEDLELFFAALDLDPDASLAMLKTMLAMEKAFLPDVAVDIQAGHLEVFRGLFCWDEKSMQEHVRVMKPDYNEFDPKTWPIITSIHINNAIGKEYDGEGPMLPRRVAYDASIFRMYASKYSEKHIHKQESDKTSPVVFQHYPLNVGRSGDVHEVGISQRDLDIWYEYWAPMRVRYEPVLDASTPAAQPIPAYEQLMKRLHSDNFIVAATTKLENELKAAKEQLAKAERDQQIKDARVKLQGELRASKEQLAQEAKTKELKALKEQVVKETNRADTAEGQILDLWRVSNERFTMSSSGVGDKRAIADDENASNSHEHPKKKK